MLDQHAVRVAEERNSRKAPLTDAEAQALLAQVSSVWVAKGRKVLELTSAEATLDDLKGPTGGYRAPIVLSGRRLLVGFHPESLERLLTGSEG